MIIHRRSRGRWDYGRVSSRREAATVNWRAVPKDCPKRTERCREGRGDTLVKVRDSLVEFPGSVGAEGLEGLPADEQRAGRAPFDGGLSDGSLPLLGSEKSRTRALGRQQALSGARLRFADSSLT